MQIVNLLKYYTINHTLHQLCRHVNPFFSKNCLNNILKNNSTLIIGWKKCEQTDKCRIDIRKLVGDRSWRWLATLPKWRFCLSQWVDILYEVAFLTARQRYTYRVLQTIQMKLILLYVWAEPAVLGSTKTALKFKYEI